MSRFLLPYVLALLGGGAAAADLTFTVTGLPSDAGTVRAALYADSASFTRQQNAVASVILQPHGLQARVTFGGLPAGRYALAVYQDVNDNGTLDTNMLSMPTEPWGFSNGAVGSFGPPGFDDAAVTLPEQGVSIVVKVHS
jgi:uncharacterized protein (DUF2141 family)